MKIIFKIISYITSFVSLLFLIALPENKYSWMEAIDQSIAHEYLEDPGNKIPLVTITAALAVIIQSIHFFKTKNSKEKFVPLIFIFSIAGILVFKFLI